MRQHRPQEDHGADGAALGEGGAAPAAGDVGGGDHLGELRVNLVGERGGGERGGQGRRRLPERGGAEGTS